MKTYKKVELPNKDFNVWKLLDFSLTELTINPKYDLYHHAIYTEMLRINNASGWSDTIGVPSRHTALTVIGGDIDTYRNKKRELEEYGMIYIIEDAKNQWTASIVTLKTEYFKAFVIGKYMNDKARGKMPANLKGAANGAGTADAGQPEGGSIRPHIIQKRGQAPFLETEEAKRESELAHAVPPAKETGRYTRYGLPDSIMEEFLTHLQEKNVDRYMVGTVLSVSHNVNVLKAVIDFDPKKPLKAEDVVKAINAIVQFLQEHPSDAGGETLKALTLTPAEKLTLKEDRVKHLLPEPPE